MYHWEVFRQEDLQGYYMWLNIRLAFDSWTEQDFARVASSVLSHLLKLIKAADVPVPEKSAAPKAFATMVSDEDYMDIPLRNT